METLVKIHKCIGRGNILDLFCCCACTYNHTPNGIINVVCVLTLHLSCKKNDPTNNVESLGWRLGSVPATSTFDDSHQRVVFLFVIESIDWQLCCLGYCLQMPCKRASSLLQPTSSLCLINALVIIPERAARLLLST